MSLHEQHIKVHAEEILYDKHTGIHAVQFAESSAHAFIQVFSLKARAKTVAVSARATICTSCKAECSRPQVLESTRPHTKGFEVVAHTVAHKVRDVADMQCLWSQDAAYLDEGHKRIFHRSLSTTNRDLE